MARPLSYIIYFSMDHASTLQGSTKIGIGLQVLLFFLLYD